MDEESQLVAAREEALQKIGRNVVVFQLLEKKLKTLVATHKLDGSPEQWQEIIDQNTKKASRLTMGSVVNRLFETVVVDESGTGESPAEASDSWSVNRTVRMEGDGHLHLKEAFDRIVRERNSLIHEDLGSFNPNCIDSCRGLSERLDAQRQNLDPMIEFISTIEETFRENGEELLRIIESGGSPQTKES